MTLTDSATTPVADALRSTAERVSRRLRSALSELPQPLCAGAGFHFGFWDAGGTPITASPGKMVRPAFVFAASRAVGGAATGSTVDAGAAVELAHNFSLVHDDVMDQDRVRRGRPTVWAQYGVPYAILLGDAMLSLANRVLLREGTENAALMSAELNSVVIDLCVGQLQDMTFEQTAEVSPEEYLEMAAGKTAALLSGSCALGGLAGGADARQVAALRAFGHHVGLAFQLVDDLLGIFGDQEVTGKPVGADLLRYKKSMPVLAAMRSGTAAGDELAGLYRDRAVTTANLGHAVALADRAGGRDETTAEARRQYDLAVSSLDEIGGEPGAVAELEALARYMISRSK
ncbi:polyprenyl synthetase family protein [Lentzea sp. HUAS12]|uniref:polyprenyl synthetase family protein n=1 Tax=Lentzea sp. HUAS12 TaxID=2951806 RepID=UPI0020A156A1|nr:polyprenyl synthetase family protein [Lentzea sp. HUAS12]USX52829.1 polyprenyl synthetase family protein [Lentzea sp. HUAS12]